MRELTPRQQRFVREYVVDLNAAQAAVRSGYSRKGARVRGAELLSNRNIQDALVVAMDQRRLRVELEADDVVRQLARVAFSNIADFVTWTEDEVRLRPTAEIDESKLVAVHSITTGQHGVAVRLHDKIRALELLAKHLGMFKEGAFVDLNVRNGSDIVARLTAKIESYAGP